MRTGAGAAFHEVRPFWKGTVAQGFALLAVVAGGGAILGDWYRPALALASALFLVPLFLRFETTVDDSELRMQVLPFWRETIALADIVATDLTIWDGQVGFFGGFSTRTSIPGAIVASSEGRDTSIGNRAVVLTLRSGKEHQLGTFRPTALLEALKRTS